MSDVKEQLSPLEQIARDELNGAFRSVFASPDGKRVLFWILEQCAIYQDAWSGENNATNYQLGRQASGRRLIEKLDEIDPRIYPQLLLDIADIKAMDRAAADKLSNNEGSDDDIDD